VVIVTVMLAPEAHAQSAPAASTDNNTFIESAREWAEKHQIVERLSGDIDGWYPRFGGLTRGAGITLGPGYRTHVFDDRVLLDVSAAMSIRRYKAVDVRARWLQAWNQRVELWTDYRFEDFPEEDFFGMGPETLLSTRTSYAYRGSDVDLRLQVKPVSWIRTGAALGYVHLSIGEGHDRDYPSIEELFTDVTAPGLLEQPDFVHTQLFVDVDYRDAPANPKRGGFYHVALSTWNDRSLDAYSFNRFDANVSQFLPMTPDRKHVISGRVGLSLTNNVAGDTVPFYFLPYVGGQDTVRSYREFRFKDENAFWIGAEYRWIPIKWVSGAVFADFGNVARDWQDVTSDLKRGYGFGLRVHSTRQTFARIDFGFGGGEGRRIFFKLGPSF
jgi:outer membrane protein assembly factor BamA